MYANGQGVERDYIWAYAWLELASKQIPDSGRLRDEVGKEMTSEQKDRARTLAMEKAEEIARNQKPAR